jgi:hypothetical protein
MIAGLISIVYISISFYYLIKSDSLFLGTKYTYPKILKKVLMIIILIDIIVQGIYNTPFFVEEDEESIIYLVFNSVGLIKVVDFKTNNITNTTDTTNTTNTEFEEVVNIDQTIEVFAKAFIYLLMSLQLLIYESKSFKKYYLVYLLNRKNEAKKSSLINSFTFNNRRVQIFGKSLYLRQQSDESMEELKNIINELNGQLNQMGKSLLYKKALDKERPLDYINKENPDMLKRQNKEYNTYNLFREDDEKENEKEKEEEDPEKKEDILNMIKKEKNKQDIQYLDASDVEQKIRDIIYRGYLINIYSWFHKQSVSYKNIDSNERIDFDIQTIKGEVTIKSIIENKLNLVLKILDLSKIDKVKMKDIELII